MAGRVFPASGAKGAGRFRRVPGRPPLAMGLYGLAIGRTGERANLWHRHLDGGRAANRGYASQLEIGVNTRLNGVVIDDELWLAGTVRK